MRPAIVDLPTWRHYTDWLQGDRPLGRDIYRGMAHASWEILSSAERVYGENFSHLAEEGLQSFSRLIRRRQAHLVPADDGEVEAFAQHHGLPTQLVDWSESPYVAAYFAFAGLAPADVRPGRHVAVWVLDTISLPTPSTPVEVAVVRVVGTGNSRLDAQFGVFTRVRGNLSLANALAAHDRSETLTQVRLPAAERERALTDLARMGISADRLFPDPGGLAQRVVWDLSRRVPVS